MKKTFSLLHFGAAIFALALAVPAAARPPQVGTPAPAFTGLTLDGKDVTLDSLRGNVVIVNFWATWCGPCKKELPLMDAYVRAQQKFGLRAVAVTMDASRVPASTIQKLQDVMSFPLLKRFKGNYEPIGNAIPTNFVIDRAGVVRYAKAGAFDLKALNTILVPLLAEPAPAS